MLSTVTGALEKVQMFLHFLELAPALRSMTKRDRRAGSQDLLNAKTGVGSIGTPRQLTVSSALKNPFLKQQEDWQEKTARNITVKTQIKAFIIIYQWIKMRRCRSRSNSRHH